MRISALAKKALGKLSELPPAGKALGVISVIYLVQGDLPSALWLLSGVPLSVLVLGTHSNPRFTDNLFMPMHLPPSQTLQELDVGPGLTHQPVAQFSTVIEMGDNGTEAHTQNPTKEQTVSPRNNM